MKKNYLLLLFGVGLLSLFACKKDAVTAAPKTITVTVKLLDMDTGKPLENVKTGLQGYELDNSQGLSLLASNYTDTNGNCTLTLEANELLFYNLFLYGGEWVEVKDKSILGYVARNIKDRVTEKRVLNHTINITTGGLLSLKILDKAIINKDTLDIDVHQIKKGNTLESINFQTLYLGSFFTSSAQLPAGYLADLPIYLNYKYRSTNIWKHDTLIFPKGQYVKYELK